MKSSIWVRCRSVLDSVMRGEIHLTADVLWLAEIDGEGVHRGECTRFQSFRRGSDPAGQLLNLASSASDRRRNGIRQLSTLISAGQDRRWLASVEGTSSGQNTPDHGPALKLSEFPDTK